MPRVSLDLGIRCEGPLYRFLATQREKGRDSSSLLVAVLSVTYLAALAPMQDWTRIFEDSDVDCGRFLCDTRLSESCQKSDDWSFGVYVVTALLPGCLLGLSWL